ncbi:MAG: MBL fold metallo-hydrolase [Verrucomicrobia bacterium]|nr:MBL fold metallo-hydrolase [Verrucomicrobiota bacterium]
MKLTFHGAAGQVTGSAYLLETDQARVLIDYGMFQGGRDADELNRAPSDNGFEGLDAVLVTHGHLDHTGRLPLLAKAGYSGPIFGTEATREITGLILKDSAKVQAQDLERVNRKRLRAEEPPLAPLYETHDVESIMSRFRTVAYDEPVPVAPGMRARFVEAGHLLGSASIELRIEHGKGRRTLVFSGDLGPKDALLMKEPAGFNQADVVVMESTYGNRNHRPVQETCHEFFELVKHAVERKGKILVPAFAVGRAQLLLYLLAMMFRQQMVPKFPVFIDSPMAIEATRIYSGHLELFDAEFQAMRQEHPLAEDLNTVTATPTAAESMKLNDLAGPCLIIAGSGMCTAGRILHHFKQNLWREGTVVIIVGFQSEGSLGRMLVEGAKQVSIFGDKIAVRARVHSLGGFSAHAGQDDLMNWFAPLAASKPRVFLTHGEAKGRETLARLIQERHGLTPEQPALGDAVELG